MTSRPSEPGLQAAYGLLLVVIAAFAVGVLFVRDGKGVEFRELHLSTFHFQTAT